MISFQVNDMTCGHCASTITKAVRSVDKGATVVVDLATHRVRIEPTEADATELADAIREAGYTPVPVADTAPESGAPVAASRCCCG